MKSFARMTKLTNIGGRADYITNEKKQEAILAKSEAVDWKPYQDFERANQRTATANNEGREMIVALPNEWASLPTKELHSRADILAQTAVGKSTDLQWAVHWNHDRTNLHLHVVFSERQKEKAEGRWDRDIYLTEDGKVARKKADRAKNPDGTDKPPVHRKGEKKGGFTAKDTTYTSKGWLHETKEKLKQTYAERWGVNIEKQDFLHQYHEGKGKEAPAIRQKNEAIKGINGRLNDLTSCYANVDTIASQMKSTAKNRILIVPYLKDGSPTWQRCRSSAEALAFLQKTEADWSARFDTSRQPQRAVLEATERTPELTATQEPTREPQTAETVVSGLPASHREPNPHTALKKPSETILDTLKGMQKAMTDFQIYDTEEARCKFWEFGKKKEFSDLASQSRAEYEALAKTLKKQGVPDDLSFTAVWFKPELLEAVKDRFTAKAEPKADHRQSLQTSLDEAKRDIARHKSTEQQNPEQDRPAVKKKKQRDIGE